MQITDLKINNLRNHIHSEFNFSDGINILFGKNGTGKTTVLEAISICSISRSFMPIQDALIVNKSSKSYSVSANCINNLSIPYKISVSFIAKEKKQINSTTGQNLLPKDIIGEMPIVVLSPDYKNITNGSPEYRRQFINTILSQASKFYMEKLFELRKILKHRNSILGTAKSNANIDFETFELWTNFYVNICTDIVLRRNDFIKEFAPYFSHAYAMVSDNLENVNINYLPNSISDIVNKEQVREEFSARAKKIQLLEMQRGTTLFGPQKDELRISINGGISRDFASQGQHKSLLIALKFAEFNYLMEKKSETPIILFDDIFSELDSDRANKVLHLLSQSAAQIFITSTDTNFISGETSLKKTCFQLGN